MSQRIFRFGGSMLMPVLRHERGQTRWWHRDPLRYLEVEGPNQGTGDLVVSGEGTELLRLPIATILARHCLELSWPIPADQIRAISLPDGYVLYGYSRLSG